MEPVKCTDCGFLCSTDLEDPHAVFTPGRKVRDAPKSYLKRYGQCLRQVAEFDPRYIQRERYCDEFTPWIAGIGAKEHLEMQQIREDQRRQQKRQQIVTVTVTVAMGLLATAAAVGVGLLNYFSR